MLRHDTIAAIATPPGTGGVGIIRISGPAAGKIARQIFQPETGQTAPGKVAICITATSFPPMEKTVLDEVLVALMPGPHSFTGEDVLEINCHGNPVIMQSILAELVQLGCRPASPGEFSQRAFLNGRIDLSQAEALAALIAARSEKARAISLTHLKGALGAEIENLRLTLD